MKTRSSSLSNLALVIATVAPCACTGLSPQVETTPAHVVAWDNQAGIWLEGVTLYSKGQYLAAADLFYMAYKLKPARRISQNIGMAYLKAAQIPEHPEILRLEYVRRAVPCLKSYRGWLASDYGKTHDVTMPLAETDQRIAEAEQLEKNLRVKIDPQRDDDGESPSGMVRTPARDVCSVHG